MSSAVKGIIGIVAAIAIPFVAPMILGALAGSTLLAGTALGGFLGTTAGATLGSAGIGAALGAGNAALTGQNVGKGALFGGIGGGLGGFTQAGGFSSLFGGGAGGAADLSAVGATNSAQMVPGYEGVYAVPTPDGIVPVAGSMAPTTITGGAAAEGIGSTISSLGSSLAKNINPSALANLAMVMYNKPPEGLTAAERAALTDTAQMAGQNQALFAQRVTEARAMLNAATPNPEQAFANTAQQVERQAREATRGGTEFDERRAAIDRQRLGAGAVATEYGRSNQARIAGLSAMPSQAPAGAAVSALPIYGLAQKREDQYNEQLAKAIGGGGMFGSKGLFG